MSCLDENQVVALAEGAISAAERVTIDAHLDVCAACRSLVAAAAAPHPNDTLAADVQLQSTTTLRTGSLVARYVILRVLGAGGMGMVYAAHDPQLDRKVAIKVLRRLDAAGADALRMRLVREAQSMARLTHPNVVAVHDVGAFDGQVFIVMEAVDGITLAHWLRDERRGTREVLRVFLQAAEGLAAAHAVGLVHRDFKPDNVLIAGDGRVLVTDFGLARSTDAPMPAPGESPVDPRQLTQTGALVGTPAYMAPEQMAGAEVTPCSDVFSFCVALYEALYRERPFAGDTVDEVRAAIVREAVREAPRGTREPVWIREIMLRGLRADPAVRPQSMRQLITELARDPAVRRRRALLLAAALLIVATAIGVPVARAVARVRACRQGGARFDRVLSPARLDALRAATPAERGDTLPAEAEGRRRSLVNKLRDYRRDWIRTFQDACEATNARGEQSPELLDLRMSCLDERLAGVDEAAVLLARGDPAVEEKLLAQSVPEPLAACSNRAALLAPTPLPRDRAIRAQVESLRARRARLELLGDAGAYHDARRQGAALLAEARALAYAPLVAVTLYTFAQSEVYDSATPKASAT